MRCPQVFTAREVIASSHTRMKVGDGSWLPARPYIDRIGIFHRIKLAWKVLTAEYDVLDWEDRYERRKENKRRFRASTKVPYWKTTS